MESLPPLYEILDTIFTTDASQSYSVIRNQITSSPPPQPSSPAAAVDFFPLEFETEDVGEEEVEATEEKGDVEAEDEKRKDHASWFHGGRGFKSPMLQLHREILDFCEFVSPTPEEEASRMAAIARVFEVIRYIWPDCRAEVFGSFRTGLYLPTSDVDVVIFNSNVRTPQLGLYALAKALSQKTIAKKVQVIAKARVPIIKFVEKESEIAFDVSFDAQNGPRAADFIKDAVLKIPPLKPLCLILKIFLQQRELNEVFLGGVGSYTLLTMLIAQLQMHWKGQKMPGYKSSAENNLGILLINFFDLYGRKLNVADVGVSCNLAGTFYSKSRKGFSNWDRTNSLSIEDPQAPDNDIGKGSFNYFKVRSAFGMAYSLLTDAKAIAEVGPNKSILATIIRPDPALLKRKGGQNGDLTFEGLLPGSEEPIPMQLGDRGDVYCNWRLQDDEPLPRGEALDETSSRSKKLKELKKKKIRLEESDSFKTPKSISSENGLRGSRKKKIRLEDNECINLPELTKENRSRESRKKKSRRKEEDHEFRGGDPRQSRRRRRILAQH